MRNPTTILAGLAFCTAVALAPTLAQADALVINHNHTDIAAIPVEDVTLAKQTPHIAYGHTSHGSQLTSGMSGMNTFINNGGLGLTYPTNFFAWNNGGSDGALDLHDYAMSGDCGYYPQWYNNTVNYLEAAGHEDVNVIIWSWCGQVDSKYADDLLDDHYLDPMELLEGTYPNVTFVYMTGHVDHWDDANNKAANQMIRDYCNANDKVLYDFADIESYDPDGAFYEFPHDNCDYYAGTGGSPIGNWATEWQESHTLNVDWYSCSCAHSVALNCNQKAYAAWALWAAIAKRRQSGMPGDMNCDGGVDAAADLPLFVSALLDPTGYTPPAGCMIDNADVNGDDQIDGADIPAFVDALLQ